MTTTITDDAYQASLNNNLNKIDTDILKSACYVNDNISKTGHVLDKSIGHVNADVLKSASEINANVKQVDADVLRTSCLQSAELMASGDRQFLANENRNRHNTERVLYDLNRNADQLSNAIERNGTAGILATERNGSDIRSGTDKVGAYLYIRK